MLRVRRDEAGVADAMTVKMRGGELKRYELRTQLTPDQTSTKADSDASEATRGSKSRVSMLFGKWKPGAKT